jgi:hypothetical protein
VDIKGRVGGTRREGVGEAGREMILSKACRDRHQPTNQSISWQGWPSAGSMSDQDIFVGAFTTCHLLNAVFVCR